MKYPAFKREESKRCKLTENDIYQILHLRNVGFSLQQIAEKYGVTKQAIAYWLKLEDERKEINKKRHANDSEIDKEKANKASAAAKKRKNKEILAKYHYEQHKEWKKKTKSRDS